MTKNHNLLHANTKTEEGLLCYHKSLTQLEETQQNQGHIGKTNSNNIISFPNGIISSDKQIFCRIKGVNNDLVYQLEHQNKVIKLSMSKSLNTLSYIQVIKNNQLYCLTIHVFEKQGKKWQTCLQHRKLKHKNKFILHGFHQPVVHQLKFLYTQHLSEWHHKKPKQLYIQTKDYNFPVQEKANQANSMQTL